jgi:hypothetical protein
MARVMVMGTSTAMVTAIAAAGAVAKAMVEG